MSKSRKLKIGGVLAVLLLFIGVVASGTGGGHRQQAGCSYLAGIFCAIKRHGNQQSICPVSITGL